MLLLALQWGGNEYPWDSATVLGLICGSIAAFLLFIWWERRQGDRAMIPGSLLHIRHIYSSCITAAFQGGSMLILTYYLALWFQVIKRASPTQSGVYILPNFASQVVLTLLSGAFGKISAFWHLNESSILCSVQGGLCTATHAARK